MYSTYTMPAKARLTKKGVPNSVSSMPKTASQNSIGAISVWSLPLKSTSACSEILNTARTAMAGTQGLERGGAASDAFAVNVLRARAHRTAWKEAWKPGESNRLNCL